MHSTLCLLLLAASTLAHAQTPATPVSPAKKELVAKLLQVQQPAFEQAARGLVERPAAQMMQDAGRFLQQQVPADRREAIGKQIEADVRRYVDETVPLVRERAIKLAPSTIGAQLEQKFTEDELRQLLAWFESPVNKKFQQSSGEMQNEFLQKLVADSRPVVEPKIKQLEQSVRGALGATAPDAAASAPRPAAKPPARPASR